MSEQISISPQEILEQVTSLPDHVAHPAVIGIAAVATGTLVACEIGYFNRIKDKWSANFSNPALAEKAIRKARGSEDVEGKGLKHRTQRLAPTIVGTVGIGIAASGLLAGFSESDTNGRDSENAVITLDQSYSMLQTRDIEGNKTRMGATLESLEEIEYTGNLGIVEAGSGTATRLSLSPDWKSGLDELSKPEVDPNGGDLIPAIDDAISLLPLEKSSTTGKTVRVGTVVAISDGTVFSNPNDTAKLMQRLNANNVNLKVIIPGTNTGQYKRDGVKNYKSGVQPENLKSLSDSVTQVDSQEEIKSALQTALKDVDSAAEKKPYHGFLWGGLGLLAASGLVGKWQRLTKRV